MGSKTASRSLRKRAHSFESGEGVFEKLEPRVFLTAALNADGPQIFETHVRNNAIEVVDIDGNGFDDAITVGDYDGSAYVEVQRILAGGRTERESRRYPLDSFGSEMNLTTGDIDGDGDIDIVTANGDHTISYLQNTGSGGFAGSTYRPINGSHQIRDVGLADFNNDGRLDLVASDYASNRIWVLLNLGNRNNGSFRGFGQQRFVSSAGTGPWGLAIADLDHDGNLDVVTADSASSAVSVYRGRGDATFDAPRARGASSGLQHVAAFDANGDHYPDLAIGGSVLTIQLGTSNLSSPTTFSYNADQPTYIAIGDLNGDRYEDVITSRLSSATYVFWGRPGGPSEDASGVTRYWTGNHMSGPVGVGSYNGDQKPDVYMTSKFDQEVIVFPGSGPGGIVGFPELLSVPRSNGEPQAADVDLDGKPDIAVADFADAAIYLYRGLGGPLGDYVRLSTPTTPGTIRFVDVDNDGDQDLTLHRGSSVWTTLNRSGSVDAFADVFDDQAWVQTEVASMSLQYIGFGNFDNDQLVDLVAVDNDRVGVFLGNGDGTFRTNNDPEPIHPDFGFDSQRLIVSDLNGDGRDDLSVADSSARVVTLLGNGDSGWQSQRYINRPLFGVHGVNEFAAVDLTGDGLDELVLVADGNRSNQIAVIRNNTPAPGLLRLVSGVRLVDDNFAGRLATGDFTGDGNNDLLVYGSLFPGDGNGGFDDVMQFVYNRELGAPIGVDLDGDDDLDVIGSSSNTIVTLFNHGDGTLSGVQSFRRARNTRSDNLDGFLTDDFNRDGVADLVTFGQQEVDHQTEPYIAVAYGTPDGFDEMFRFGFGFDQGGIELDEVRLADLDNDGDNDIVIERDGYQFVSFMNRAGGFEPVMAHEVPFGESDHWDLGDLNLDGKPDLVYSYDGERVRIALGRGGGQFDTLRTYSFGQSIFDIQIARINQGAAPDVVYWGQNNDYFVRIGGGNGTLGIQGLLLPNVTQRLTLADLDKDGRDDVINDAEDLEIHRNISGGQFPTLAEPTVFRTAFGVSDVLIADFNNDGNDDVIIPQENNGNWVDVFFGIGNGFFDGRVRYYARGGPETWQPGDIEGDGDVDLISYRLGERTETWVFENLYVNPQMATGDVPGPFFAGPGTGFNGTGTSNGGVNLSTSNELGEIVIIQRDGNGEYEARDLADAIGSPIVDGNVLSFVDPTDGTTWIAAVTEDFGLSILEDSENGFWRLRTIQRETITQKKIVGNLTTFTLNNTVHIVGLNTFGELVDVSQDGRNASGDFIWRASNISREDLTPNGQMTPEFTGQLISYTTPSGVMGVAGLASGGNVYTVTKFGNNDWMLTNATNQSGAPKIDSALATFVTAGSAVHIAGIETFTGDLRVLRKPNGQAWSSSNYSFRYGGPRLERDSLTAYVTPWGGQNVLGIHKTTGDLIRYQWLPGSTWRVNNVTASMPAVPRLIGITNFIDANNQVNVLGTTEDGRLFRYTWDRGQAWELQDVSAIASGF